MVVENAALFAVSEMLALPTGERADVLAVRPKVVRDLVGADSSLTPTVTPPGEVELGPGQLIVTLGSQDSLNKVAQDCERQYFAHLFVAHRGDFGRMAQVLLGDTGLARKVQLRFNQLGLKVREMKEQLV